MKIAYIQGSYGGAQITGYPISLQILPLLRELIEKGNEITQVFPSYAHNGLILKYFNDKQLCREKLQEHFNLGVKPCDTDHESFNPKDFDKLVMWACPWTDRNTYKLIELLQKFTDAGVPILYIQSDDEFHNNKSESLIFKVLKNQHPDIFNNIKQYITCVPTYPDKLKDQNKDAEVKFIPTLYDSRFELPISNLDQKEYVFQFPGPVGYRHTLYNNLEKFIGLNGLKSAFWNESMKEQKKSRTHQAPNPYTLWKDNDLVEFHEEALYLSFPDSLKFQQSSLFGFMDSITPDFGLGRDENYHTSRVANNCYSGIISLFTDTKTLRDYISPDVYKTMNLENLTRDMLLDMVKTNEVYQEIVSNQRKEMHRNFDISVHYDSFIDLLRK